MHAAPRSLAGYLQEMWRCRYFWLSLVRNDLQNRYRRSVLGVGWSLLHPLALTTVVCVVFHTVLDQDIRTYAPFLLAGIATWSFLSSCLLAGCNCFVQGEAYIRQHPAPLAIYPLRVTLAASFHWLISLSVVGLLAAAFREPAPGAALALLAVVPLVGVAGWSLATLGGLAHTRFRDSQHLAEVAMQLLFYATPVIYPRAMLADNRLGWLFRYNPLALFLELVRLPLVDGHWPAAATWQAAFAFTAALFLTAVAALARSERRLPLDL